SATHGAPLGDDEIAAVREALGWGAAPFEIPEQVLSDWRGTAERGSAARAEWRNRLEAHGDKAEFERRMAGDLPESFSL
ncbi:MAG TPA: transketolase, partial [Erythrobacter sp.]|nr:transketolase [Erythrobacter sp.]